jgi:hypothetical protein
VRVVMSNLWVSVRMVPIQSYLEFKVEMAVVWVYFRIVEFVVTKDQRSFFPWSSQRLA